MNQRTLIIGVAAIAVLLFGVVQMNSKEDAAGTDMATSETSELAVSQPTNQEAEQAPSTPPATPVTGGYDDLVAEMSLETSGEASLLSDTETDKALLNSDRDALQGYTTTYDETAL